MNLIFSVVVLFAFAHRLTSVMSIVYAVLVSNNIERFNNYMIKFMIDIEYHNNLLERKNGNLVAETDVRTMNG